MYNRSYGYGGYYVDRRTWATTTTARTTATSPDKDNIHKEDKYDKYKSTNEKWSKAYRDARKCRQAHARAMLQNKIVDQTLVIEKLRNSLIAWQTWYNSGGRYSFTADVHLYNYAADDHWYDEMTSKVKESRKIEEARQAEEALKAEETRKVEEDEAMRTEEAPEAVEAQEAEETRKLKEARRAEEARAT